MGRTATIKRRTKETEIEISVQLDGTGKSEISTGVGFFDHMLTHLAKHSRWDLTVKAKGDLHVDAHHTVEDVGICLGTAIKDALGDKAGLQRFAGTSVPMDETLANVALDISGRPSLVYNVQYTTDKIGDFDIQLVHEFFQAVVNTAGITMHVNVPYGTNSHHIAEAIFKATAQALGTATKIIDTSGQIPSTKGTL
ncbi:MAG: imidazoleglycerol-phosphate dehydratase HisB [Phycisphaerae bacterium]